MKTEVEQILLLVELVRIRFGCVSCGESCDVRQENMKCEDQDPSSITLNHKLLGNKIGPELSGMVVGIDHWHMELNWSLKCKQSSIMEKSRQQWLLPLPLHCLLLHQTVMKIERQEKKTATPQSIIARIGWASIRFSIDTCSWLFLSTVLNQITSMHCSINKQHLCGHFCGDHFQSPNTQHVMLHVEWSDLGIFLS